jgi:hypothetical protein
MRVGEAARTAGVLLRNIVLGGNLASLSLIGRPRQLAQYVAESLFLLKAIGVKRGIPQKNVFEVLQCENIEPIILANLKGDPGYNFFGPVASYTADLISLCLICRAIHPKAVFEIGTMHGYTALHLALNSPEGARVYTLDLPKDRSIQPRLPMTLMDEAHLGNRASGRDLCFEGTAAEPKISCLCGDSATFDYSPFLAKVDLFFIDGAHSYDYVRSDTLNAIRCCHPGSVIAWHDFGRAGVNGVSRWILELSRQYRIYSVPGGTLAFTVLE